VLEEAAGISGLHARRHEAELRLRAAEQNLLRLEDVIGQLATQMDALKKQARQAIRYRTRRPASTQGRGHAVSPALARRQCELAEAEQAKNAAVRLVAERTGEQAEASTRQANISASCRPCVEAEARAAAGLQRLTMARDALEREEQRAATAWPSSTAGWSSSATTSSANGALPPTRRPR